MQIHRKMLRAKIHRAIVTEADLDYEGSLTIPPELMKLADIKEYEAVQSGTSPEGRGVRRTPPRGNTGREGCV